MSWIHIDDLVGLFRLAIERPVQGAINGVAPSPVTNADFTKALGATLHRPVVAPMPAFGLKLMFGEMAEVLLASQRAVPRAAESAGYSFRFRELQPALADLLK
jgi:NAD dependent epimerase/dehydratase family enzyme